MKRISVTKQHLEIFSGSLLAKRGAWQQLKTRLPAHACLLITSLDNPLQTQRMCALGRSFQKHGVSVFVLSVG